MARVLIGYSRCKITRAAFEAMGHEVWTCDLLPKHDDDPSDRHLQCDIWDVARDRWDAGVFHPMCTNLTVTAAWAFNDPDYVRYPGVGYHQKVKPGTLTGKARRDGREADLENFRKLLELPYRKALENPARSFLNKAIKRPTQVVQPYEYGDDASKATGLWLDRLPPLRPNPTIVMPRYVNGLPRWGNQTDSGQNALGPSEERWLQRSATYPGIANAFGRQWGAII